MEHNLTFTSNFRVMPDHCNDQLLNKKLISGGSLFWQMDLAAYGAVNQLLQHSDSVCDTAVTFVWNGKFLAPSYLGDLIEISATVFKMSENSVTVDVKAVRWPHSVKNPQPVKVAQGEFVFVTMEGDKYKPHGLKMEDYNY